MRLKELCCKIWKLLSEDEQEGYFCGDGTYGFIENVAALIYVDIAELSDEEMEDIANALDEI